MSHQPDNIGAVADDVMDDAVLARDIAAARVRLLHANAGAGTILLVPGIAIFVALMWPMAPHDVLLVWASLMWAVLLARAFICYRFVHRLPNVEESVRASRLLHLAMALYGAMWGVAGAVFFVPDSIYHQVFLGTVLVWLSLGALWNVAVSPLAVMVVVLPALVPLAARLLIEGGTGNVAFGAMLLLLAAGIAVVAKRTQRWALRPLKLAARNAHLIDKLARTTGSLQAVLANIAEALWVVDKDGRLNLCNQQFIDLFNLPEHLARPGTPFEDMFRYLVENGEFGPGEVDDVVMQNIAVMRRGEPVNYERTRPDGRVIEVRGNPMPEGGVVATFTDITVRKNAERDLMQAQKMESLGNFAGGIAHNLNNMLQPMLALSQLTIDRLSKDSEEREFLEKVIQAGFRAKSLVNQILTFGRQHESRRERIDMFALISESMALLRSTIPSTIRVMERLDRQTGIVVADVTLAETILMNLVSNAVDAMKNHTGEIVVSLSGVEVDAALAGAISGLTVGRYAKLSVADTGPGMDTRTVDRVFDPFFTTKDVGEGTGLGLSTAHGILSGHRGAISIASTPGVGTVVDAYLPLAEDGAR